MPKTICLALTGASGMPYGLRLLECLLAAGCRVQLLYSQAAQVVAKQELDFELPSRPNEAKAAEALKRAEEAKKDAKSDIDFAAAQSEFAAMAAQIAALRKFRKK